jgi:hypothetical protein
MEISGEVDITIDQYADFEIDLDVDRLAEELATDHNFVDDTVLHAHVAEYCDSYIDDLVSEHVDALVGAIDGLREQYNDLERAQFELHDQVKELQPDNNYVRINDLRTIIEEVARAEICIAFAAGHHKMQEKLNKVPPPNGLTNSNWGEENKEG